MLFGPATVGRVRSDEPLEMLVVAETENTLDLAADVYGNLLGVGIPVHLLVATPAEVEHRRQTDGLIYPYALDQGLVVYETKKAAASAPDGSGERPPRDPNPDPAILEEVVRRVVEVANPRKIIVFGPAARGELLWGRDLPLLIVAETGHARNLAGEIYMRLKGVGIGVAAVVATPARVERYRHQNGLVFKYALETGTVVYDAA